MHFTDIFIRRPVLATVVSLVIILLGIRAAMDLTVRQYPELSNNQVKITVPWPGADPEVIANFITTPIERVIGAVGGVDFINSLTGQGVTTITLNLELDKDPNEALTEVSAAVNKLRNQLPEGSEDPVIEVGRGGGTSAMYLAFYSELLNEGEITDYLLREVEPRLASLEGIEQVRIIGAQTYAMRIWMRPESLVAYDLTPGEVRQALRTENVLAAVGETRGSHVKMGLSVATDVASVEAFRDLVVKADSDRIVRLSDVADVELGAENYDLSAAWDAQPAIFIGIDARPDANVLDVIGRINEVFPEIQAVLPEGLNAEVGYDSTEYIRTAISEVQLTLLEAIAIVIAVIFLFLGSARSAFIPAVTVPVSLIGALFLMLVMGFTINLLTLLAMVLAIGMVVDDAIIVLENIHRHIEAGMTPKDAAIKGARELVGPVIAMTVTLVAVYAPIGFQGGITGALFIEFAFTLAGAVLISGVVALTLTPMMCAKLLKAQHENTGFVAWLDRRFESWRDGYQNRLHAALDTHYVVAFITLVAVGSLYGLVHFLPDELAPQEDPGFAFAVNETDSAASQDWLDHLSAEVNRIVLDHPLIEHTFYFSAPSDGSTNRSFLGMIASPWDERDKTIGTVIGELQAPLSQIPGMRSSIIQPPALPTPGQGYPVEFVLKASVSPQELADVGAEVLAKGMASGKMLYMAPRLRMDKPEIEVVIDREKAALLGVPMAQIADDLSAAFSAGMVNRFAFADRSYRVIAQVERAARLNPEQLNAIHTRAANGELVPISTFVTLKESVVARTIEHAQQLNANTLVGVPKPGVTIGEALETLEQITAEVAPADFQVDYSGPARQFKQETDAMWITLAFAVVCIFLVLAAQFESFVDPIIMLVTVPVSIFGALLVFNLFGLTNNIPTGDGGMLTNLPGMTLNIYTKVGLVTLVGVIAKHGILMVEFANKLQLTEGLSKRAAIEKASAIRMRPILMTTAALVVAMFPLLMSDGPGAAARFSMGMVIVAGMTIGTLFTLYVVPMLYLYIGRNLTPATADA